MDKCTDSQGFCADRVRPQHRCQATACRVVALADGPRVPIRRRSLRHHGRVPDARLPPGSRLVLPAHIAGRDYPGTPSPARRRLARAMASVRATRVGQAGPGVAPVAGPATGRGGANLGLPVRRFRVGSGRRARLPDRVQRTPRRQAGAREAARLRAPPGGPARGVPARSLRPHRARRTSGRDELGGEDHRRRAARRPAAPLRVRARRCSGAGWRRSTGWSRPHPGSR